MTITYVRGDILLSRAPVLGFGFNAQGAAEVTPLITACMDRFPAAFAAFRKQTRAGRIRPGDVWLWREAKPWLALLAVRQNASGASRPRYVESVAQTLARDWRRAGIARIALARLGEPLEWPMLRSVLDYWLASIPLEVVVYEEHLSGVRVREPWDDSNPES